MIRIERNGQRTRYVAINNQLENVTLGASLFGTEFVDSHQFGREGLISFLQENQTSQNQSEIRRINLASNCKSRLDSTILEFANQVGGFITYSFIQALNRENIINKLLLLKDNNNSNKSKKQQEQEQKQTTEQEDINNIIEDWNQIRLSVGEWLKNSVCSNNILIKMLLKFSQIIEPYGFVPDTATDTGLKKRKELGMYFLDKEHIDKLENSFSNVYPILYSQLEKLCEDLPKDIISEKKYMASKREYTRNKLEKQKRCRHKFSSFEPIAERDDHKRQILQKHCIKCGYVPHDKNHYKIKPIIK